MARHGWRGAPPRDDEDAAERIIEAAMRCIDRHGAAKTTLSDVAAELGVTRQTVYRYFPSTDELFGAVGRAAADNYLDRLAVHLAGTTDPAELVVEALAFTLERLPAEPYLSLLLATGRSEAFSRGVMSPAASAFGREMLSRTDVDWPAAGYSDGELTELVRFLLRNLQSLAIDPPVPHSEGPALRAYLRRWVAPSIVPVPVDGGHARSRRPSGERRPS
jgi:AcrR family transcriptional regulator